VGERNDAWTEVRARDRKVVARCLEGDEDAWAELWSRYGPLVKYTARRAGCDDEECRDVLQRVALVALQNLDRLREPAKLPAWLAGIARFQALDLIRQQRQGVELHPGVATTDHDPTESMERDQRAAALRQAMVQLDPRCRRLIHRLELSERAASYQEVAKEEGLAASSIGPIRRRCLKKLKSLFLKLSQSAPIGH